MGQREARKLAPSPLMLYVPVQQSSDQSKGVCLPGWKIHSERLEESDTAQWDNVKVRHSIAIALRKWTCLRMERVRYGRVLFRTVRESSI